MKKRRIFLFLFFLFLVGKSSSQSVSITTPRVEFNGDQLLISYDVISKNLTDQFYVWIEIEKKNGEPIQVKALSGDVGENVKGGANKQISWIPEKDSIFLNEEVFVEVKAEKYVKSFNKGSAMLMSTVMPGLGQTKISKGKPWWLTGVAAYGALAGGLIVHNSYIKTFDSYRIEENPSVRADLLNQAQQQMNLSSVLIVSGAAIWAANIFWVAMTPNKYKPLQNVKLSLYQSTGPYKGTTLLSLRLNF
ncbi:MAG TPA: hypothetical protein VMV77_21745 [Bacteroidales bacterium]|nr:hypothetical protein [Bacteroidales bacterium]